MWFKIDKKDTTPKKFFAFIEIPKGSKNKYEFDYKYGLIKLDRILYTSTHYPANYGFIPNTTSDDGDNLDVLVLCQEPIHPMVITECKPIGLITMTDDKKSDEKIIAVPIHDPTYSSYEDIKDLPEHLMNEISHFFDVYKTLENKKSSVLNVKGKKAATICIEKALKAYDKINNRSDK